MNAGSFPEELTRDIPGDSSPAEHESLYKQIMDMSVSQKVKLAMLGNKEARGLLIKDPNRIIVHAVINNPRLTEEEVVSYASNRNYSKEVSRLISDKKEFIKSYKVMQALVCNPKTPVPTALKLLRNLRENDLRRISKSKNVSSVVARTAMRLLATKGRV